ncbi:hypothetical protein MOKP118_45140 [Mycobacterium avium subsp. hominissuis]
MVFVPTSITDIPEALSRLADYLRTLPLEALQLFQGFIPGAAADAFNTVESAVETIVNAILVDPLGSIRTVITQIIEIFQGLAVTPVNEGVQSIKDWVNGLNSYKSTTTTELTNQNTWLSRLITDVLILLDFFHLTYPVGSPTDTATTTVGGKRTWWSASVDLNDLFHVQTGGTNPQAAPATMGQSIQALEQTVTDLSNQVTVLTTASDGRSKMADSFAQGSGSNNDWGPNFTVSGTGSSHLADSVLVWDSSTIGDYLQGITSYATPGDIQVIKMTLQTAIQYGGKNTIRARVGASWSRYVFARFSYNQVELGYYNGTSETVWDTKSCSPSPGAQLELWCGDNTSDWKFYVLVNSQVVASYNDTAHVSAKGSSYRLSGLRLESGSFWGFNSPPGNVTYFEAGDGSTSNVTGTGMRVYRNSTAYVGSTVTTTMPTNYYDTVDYCSSDIHWNGLNATVDKAGQYMVSFEWQCDANNAYSFACYATVFLNGVQYMNSDWTTRSNMKSLQLSTVMNCQAGDVIEPGASFASATRLGRITGGNPPALVISKVV